MTNLNAKRIGAALLTSTMLIPYSGIVAAQDTDKNQEIQNQEESSTTVYGPEFFATFNNLISALDMVQRVPGGSALLGNGGGGGSRGFGSNQDTVLINGKRISGKDNDSRSALGRISVSQVARIEVIRGSSPDVKVSSQSSFVNVVLSEDAKGGSGTWEIGTKITKSGRVAPTSTLSYSGKTGRLEYFIEADLGGHVADVDQEDLERDALGTPLTLQKETTDHRWTGKTLSTNLTYNMLNGDQLRLNGVYAKRKWRRAWAGELFDYDPMGALVDGGDSIRYTGGDTPSWEIGGDYETDFNEKLHFKILGLYSSRNSQGFQSEDALITSAEPQVDFDVRYSNKSTEAILRPSVTWKIKDGHSIEIGEEIAINKTNTGLEYYELELGDLVLQDIDNATSAIKETRSESFMNYSWKISPKLNLESSLIYEYSRISQDSSGVNTTQSFNYLKPSVDIRYDVNKRDQIQFSVRRSVSQLNFGDFASSVSGDDEVIAGNTSLQPEKTWTAEASYEHRFLKDTGQIKFSIQHHRITDNIAMIEVQPGIAGVGNTGKASRTNYRIEGSLKLTALGMKNVTIEGRATYRDTNEIDAFTGLSRDMNGMEKLQLEMDFRHDINKWGLTYGASFFSAGPETHYDIDEIRFNPHRRTWLDVYVEKKVFGSMVFSIEAVNLFNVDDGRRRELYDAGIAGGVLTGTETRSQLWGSRLQLNLKSTF